MRLPPNSQPTLQKMTLKVLAPAGKITGLPDRLEVMYVRKDLAKYVEKEVGLNKKAKPWATRGLKGVRIIGVHHEGGRILSDSYDGFDEVKRDAKYHVEKNWGTAQIPYYAPNLAYTYQIDRKGIIYLCNDLEAITWHSRGANAMALSICMQGNLAKQDATQAQIKSLYMLLDYLVNWRKGSRKVITAGKKDVYGHWELHGRQLGFKYTWRYIDFGNYTACPGEIKDRVIEFRNTGTIAKAFSTNEDLPNVPNQPVGNDLDPKAWYYPFAMACINTGIMRGFDDGTFRPSQPVTRAEIAKVAVGIAMNHEKLLEEYRRLRGT